MSDEQTQTGTDEEVAQSAAAEEAGRNGGRPEDETSRDQAPDAAHGVPAQAEPAEADAARGGELDASEVAATAAAGQADAPLSAEEAAAQKASRLAAARAQAAGQQEMPFAFVAGKAVTDLPKDLYIPPDALEVFLEAFEGPLDLLLYLIRRQNIDIVDINVAEITDQYMGYVELMEASRFELAAEYLVMAAMLAEIKSRILLPRPPEEDEDEEDPRTQLIRRLQEYERYREAAERLDELPRMERDFHQAKAKAPTLEKATVHPDVDLQEILIAFAEVLRRSDLFESHHIQRETLTTREKMSEILLRISDRNFTPLVSLLMKDEGRAGVVVTFLAVMELIKESLIELVQNEPFGPIHIKARSS